ncbi:FtsX-like permease family protein [Phytoactinopolyspora endophytica]|uniref:ABC transporter permease n=1 Tax=Phytoactinopolyspora endophytica TaxID=1642495 RepID=UPI00101B9C69|nr:FtsX-like permease family protein [Phytoactinopolyspora endophytica]
MAAVAYWLRLDVRRRWRSLLVLTLLIAFATGTVMTAVAGARRGADAIDRLIATTRAATVQVLPNDPRFDWDVVRALPGVEGVGEMLFAGVEMDGRPAELPVLADTVTMYEIERPVVLEGRLADPSLADEAVVTPRFLDAHGKDVGDVVTLRLYRPESLAHMTVDWRDPAADDGPLPADGPTLDVRIVGVVRSFLLSEGLGDSGWLVPSPGLFAEYSTNLQGPPGTGATSAIVRLAGGSDAVAGFNVELAAATGRTDISTWNLAQSAVFDKRIVNVETTGLAVFGVVAGVAAVFLVGQAIARYAAASISELAALRPVGLSAQQSVVAAAIGPSLAGSAGAALGAVAALIASRWFPIGTASLREPAPGTDADWPVLAVGWTAVSAVIAAGAVGAAMATVRASRMTGAPRRSVISAAMARIGFPLPVVLGTRFALEPGRGRHAVPVRPALLGAVVGVLGVVAAITLARGIDDASGNPARYGQVHEIDAVLGYEGQDVVRGDAVLPVLAADPDVEAVNDSRSAVAEMSGATTVVYSLDPVTTPMNVVVSSGRLPSRPDEVALAPYNASLLGVGVGDTVELTGTQRAQALTVTGLAFVPEGPENYNVDGAWVTASGYDALFDTFAYHVAHIVLRSGADPVAVAARLESALAGVVGDEVIVQPTLQRDHSVELREIRAFPIFLAVFLAVLAVGAVSHALATAVRRRRYDIAVLRAVGLTRRQSRGAVVTQAMVIAVWGLVAGIPLGVALGRTVWRYVADTTVTHYVPPALGWSPVPIIVGVLLTAIVLAAWPSQRAASIRVGSVLRAE